MWPFRRRKPLHWWSDDWDPETLESLAEFLGDRQLIGRAALIRAAEAIRDGHDETEWEPFGDPARVTH